MHIYTSPHYFTVVSDIMESLLYAGIFPFIMYAATKQNSLHTPNDPFFHIGTLSTLVNIVTCSFLLSTSSPSLLVTESRQCLTSQPFEISENGLCGEMKQAGRKKTLHTYEWVSHICASVRVRKRCTMLLL